MNKYLFPKPRSDRLAVSRKNSYKIWLFARFFVSLPLKEIKLQGVFDGGFYYPEHPFCHFERSREICRIYG